MNGHWYGQQEYPQWYRPQGYPWQGYPPWYGGFAQEEYVNNAYGYPAQGYNYLYAQPPQWMWQNRQSGNAYNQPDGGMNNPQIQGVDEIANLGNINMGTNSGTTQYVTTSLKEKDMKEQKQIQGANGGLCYYVMMNEDI